MPLSNIQLCHMDPIDRAAGTFSVTAHSDAGDQFATFRCSSEHAARDLRNAIRENADALHGARDYRERPGRRPTAADVALRCGPPLSPADVEALALGLEAAPGENGLLHRAAAALRALAPVAAGA